MVLRSLIAYSVRVPMIKFRKGGFSGAAAAAPMPSSGGPAPAASTPPAAGPAPPAAPVQEEPQYSSNAIEDWELPARYRRSPINQDEMDYINRGGPA